ncbi:MAG: terpene cyclase/mutase family protein [Planctomycetaceae bacterium]|nr:terpene cyclase/mutase family protein [Planctomycetaceae bacterium]
MRQFVWNVLLVLILADMVSADEALPQPGGASGSRDSRTLITPPTQAAIDAGLAWLASQQHADGSFGSVFAYQQNVAVAGLCGMSFLASGSTPGRGPYGETVSRTMDYVISCAQPNGFLSEPQAEERYHGPMYGHGFATLFLAEAYGMSPREDVDEVLRRAVRLIIDSQNEQGGWRYNPRPEVADISVTVCQVMALRAARNCGISVPKETIDRSVDYIRRSQNNDGGFKYQLLRSAESQFPRSAAALVALYTSGIHEGDVIDRGLQYMIQFRPSGLRGHGSQHFHYGHYYAVQAAWHAGGDYWQGWYPAVRDDLLASQSPRGFWPNTWIGAEYGTAMSLLVLQTPNNLLPIFER